MKRYSLVAVLACSCAVTAMRNPFENSICEKDSTATLAISSAQQVSLSGNSTWQVTQHDETTMILKNQDGEIREVRVAPEQSE